MDNQTPSIDANIGGLSEKSCFVSHQWPIIKKRVYLRIQLFNGICLKFANSPKLSFADIGTLQILILNPKIFAQKISGCL